MKVYQLIYQTTYNEHDEGFSFESNEEMAGKIYLRKEKADAEVERIKSLDYWEQMKYTTRSSGFLSGIRIAEIEVIE